MSILLIIFVYGLPLSLILSILLLTIIRLNPRLMLQDYPEDIQAVVSAQTPGEQRQSCTIGLVLFFLILAFSLAAALTASAVGYGFPGIFFSAAGVPLLFNMVD
jgi:hypothetical protein